MSRFLIINADDFGCCKEQNEAIKELWENNLITSVSVLAVAPEFEDAANWLKSKGLSAGVHLTLNSDEALNPWRSITGAKSLGKNGNLHSNSKDITFHARRRDVSREIAAQYNAIKNAGIKVDHADSHSGTLYGLNLRRFYIDAFRFCGENGLPYRFPKRADFIERMLGRKPPAALYKFHSHLVNLAKKNGVCLIDDMLSNPWSIDKIKDKDSILEYYLNAVKGIGEGITEIFLHPAKPKSEEKTPWTKRVYECEILKSGALLEAAKKNGIEIISWADVREINNYRRTE